MIKLPKKLGEFLWESILLSELIFVYAQSKTKKNTYVNFLHITHQEEKKTAAVADSSMSYLSHNLSLIDSQSFPISTEERSPHRKIRTWTPKSKFL